jgi:hypothetical protein
MRRVVLIISALAFPGLEVPAQSATPTGLQPDTSGRSIQVGNVVKLSREVRSTRRTYTLAAGKYQAEYVSEHGTYYRGPKDCMTETVYSYANAVNGIGFGPTAKFDCGIVLDATGHAWMYQYRRVAPGNNLNPLDMQLKSRRMVRAVRTLTTAQEDKPFVVPELGQLPELEGAIVIE